jgi:protein-tyrosine-phosphatase
VGELVRLGRAVGPRRADESVASWARRVSATRARDEALGRATDEVDDPAGEPIEVYRRTAAVLDRSLAEIVELLVPPA